MRLSFCAALTALSCCVGVVSGYIDVPANRLTLCEVMLEFPTVLELELHKSDPARGAFQFDVVEVFQGKKPKDRVQLALLDGDRMPARLSGMKVGDRIVAFMGSPDNRSLFVAEGGWFIARPDRNWERFHQFRDDFRSLFAGPPRELADAIRTLQRGGRVTVPIHPKGLGDTDRFYVRYDAAFPHRRWPSLPPKFEPLHDAQARVSAGSLSPVERANAMLSIEARNDGEAILRRGLRDSRPEVRLAAIIGLHRVRSSSDETIADLTRCLADDDRFVCAMAAWSLGQMKGAARGALPELEKALADRDWAHDFRPHRGAEAAEAILAIAPESDSAKRAIRFFLSDRMLADQRKDREGTCTAAARALGRSGRAASEALPELMRALKDEVPETRIAAAEAIHLVGGNADQCSSARSVLQKEVMAGTLASRIQAIRATAVVRASTLLPELLSAANDDDPDVRREAKTAIDGLRK